MIIDKTTDRSLQKKKGLWANKMNAFIPKGLNLRNFM